LYWGLLMDGVDRGCITETEIPTSFANHRLTDKRVCIHIFAGSGVLHFCIVLKSYLIYCTCTVKSHAFMFTYNHSIASLDGRVRVGVDRVSAF
jgi:hypothetical protein